MDLRYAPGVSDTMPPDFIDNFEFDHRREGWIVAQDDEFDYMVIGRQVTTLLVLSQRENNLGFWTWGWRYARFEAVVADVSTWDPTTEDEPLRWHKRSTYEVRKAPGRMEKPSYNRPRCVHGSYMVEPCTQDRHCETNRESGRMEWELAGRPAMW